MNNFKKIIQHLEVTDCNDTEKVLGKHGIVLEEDPSSVYLYDVDQDAMRKYATSEVNGRTIIPFFRKGHLGFKDITPEKPPFKEGDLVVFKNLKNDKPRKIDMVTLGISQPDMWFISYDGYGFRMPAKSFKKYVEHPFSKGDQVICTDTVNADYLVKNGDYTIAKTYNVAHVNYVDVLDIMGERINGLLAERFIKKPEEIEVTADGIKLGNVTFPKDFFVQSSPKTYNESEVAYVKSSVNEAVNGILNNDGDTYVRVTSVGVMHEIKKATSIGLLKNDTILKKVGK